MHINIFAGKARVIAGIIDPTSVEEQTQLQMMKAR